MQSQCSEWRRGETWQCFGDLNTIRAALFRTFWSLSSRRFGVPARRELQESTLERTKAHIRFWLHQQKDNGEWYYILLAISVLVLSAFIISLSAATFLHRARCCWLSECCQGEVCAGEVSVETAEQHQQHLHLLHPPFQPAVRTAHQHGPHHQGWGGNSWV